MVFLPLLACIGATLIVARSTIFAPLQRAWPPLFRCCQCVGFWIGATFGASGVFRTGNSWWCDFLIVGFATSGASMIVDAVLLNLLGHPEA